MKVYRTATRLCRDERCARYRMALVIDSRGVSIEYQCPKVGGGYYNKDSQTFPWPWRKVD